MKSITSNRFLVAAVLPAIFAVLSSAAAITWTGVTTGNWNTGTNWSLLAVPLITDDLLILGPGNVAGALTINAADSADPDGDGWTNAQEYASGTNPNDRASLLKINKMQRSGSDMVVGFTTVIGKTYRVERSDTLQTGSWIKVQGDIPGAGGTVQVADTGGAAQPRRFYRIVVTP
ncbi:MAG: thrombospondin type 3 repeat-containing protein [Verrucomicrobiota bacterium]